MLTEAFERDWRTRTFREGGGLELGEGYEPLVLKPLDQVAGIIALQRAPLIVAKPLCESQNAPALVRAVPGSKVVWVYRDFRPVAASNALKFPKGKALHENLTAVIEARAHWYSQHVTPDVRSTVRELYRPDRSPIELWALAWYVRNTNVLRYTGLPMAMTRYRELVMSPSTEMRKIYRFLGTPYPGDRIVRHVDGRGSRGDLPEIGRDIASICEELLAKLDALNSRITATL